MIHAGMFDICTFIFNDSRHLLCVIMTALRPIKLKSEIDNGYPSLKAYQIFFYFYFFTFVVCLFFFRGCAGFVLSFERERQG